MFTNNKINKKIMKGRYFLFGGLLIILSLAACRKLPEKQDYLSQNASFNKLDIYEPVLGRTTLELTQFSADGSTYPLTFSLENERHADESPAPELSQNVKVQEWQRDYTGKETSIDEIEKKRIWVEKPFLEIRKGSGDFIFWNAPSTLIRTYPDSGYLFDVKVNNGGNSRVFKDFLLRPVKEVPYEPYEYDIHTRERMKETRVKPDGKTYTVDYTIHPSFITNMYYTKDSLFTDTLISVYFYKADEKSPINTLSLKFLDAQFNPINPDKFVALTNNDLKPTQWDSLVHGFNMQKTTTEVTYQAAYPIPLSVLPTKYASGGIAHVAFGYSRKGFGGRRIDASFGLDFSIYEPGNWTIVFYFRRDPRFEDD